MKDNNERIIGGQVQFRRFAYLHKHDHSQFGLLEAVDYKDAKCYLGSQYHVRKTWLTMEEVSGLSTDRKREIVSSIFLNRLSKASL